MNQAQLLSDQLFYSDSLDAQQWLIYYISKPLVGSYEPVKITPALLPDILKGITRSAAVDRLSKNDGPTSPSAEKKEVNGFSDILNQFPMIARQMYPGFEQIFKDFAQAMNEWVPASPRKSSFASRTSASSTLKSNGSIHSRHSVGSSRTPSIARSQLAEEVGYMRTRLELAISSAIELFQGNDKQQLTLLGTSTALTGSEVEKMIEIYVTEQLHDTFLFPRLCNGSMKEDLDLESKIHRMQYLDVAQIGILIEHGRQEKEQLVSRIKQGTEEFRKLSVSRSPQQMIEILLSAQRMVTGQARSDEVKETRDGKVEAEKQPPQPTNADTLVSLLLVIIIKSQVRHLHARLSYMRDFSIIEDVDTGERGYALSTLEAVLSYLTTDSAGLSKASSRNKRLWQATKKGDIAIMRAILESQEDKSPSGALTPLSSVEDKVVVDKTLQAAPTGDYFVSPDAAQKEPQSPTEDGYVSEGSTLAHVFPFQAETTKKKKKVSIDRRSLSNASEYSYISRTTTHESMMSVFEGDTSVETLAQTQDSNGSSVLMMAVESQQSKAFRYLLSLQNFYPTKFIFEDVSNEGTTLLSAAVQINAADIIHVLLDRLWGGVGDLDDRAIEQDFRDIMMYLARPDSRGRAVAHYLFNAPWLLPMIGKLIMWKQKDKMGQTPLLALCRSYDHPDYFNMVDAAMSVAGYHDEKVPLYLDDHVDAKGNTLLHVVNDPTIIVKLLQ